jgi:hypothetical protein
LLGAALALAGCMPGATPRWQGKDHAPRAGVDVRLSAVDAAGKGTPAHWQGETLALREPPIAGSADIADVRYVLDGPSSLACRSAIGPKRTSASTMARQHWWASERRSAWMAAC